MQQKKYIGLMMMKKQLRKKLKYVSNVVMEVYLIGLLMVILQIIIY